MIKFRKFKTKTVVQMGIHRGGQEEIQIGVHLGVSEEGPDGV